MATAPLFILSTPRSGSTLLQRILASHSRINTSPEPYLLLPFVYALKKEGVFAHYHQGYQAKGLTEFCEFLPEKKETYYKAVRQLSENLYAKAANHNQYFLDKTPFYDLIVDDVIKIFPQAKFIVLVRNPIAAIASAVQLWGLGHWRLFPVYDTMVAGQKKILAAAQQYKDRICLVKFENMTANPTDEIQRITDYLNLEFEQAMVSGFTQVSFKGKMGDPTAEQYSSVSKKPLEKWKETINTPLRKAWIKRYLKYLGPENLSAVGYDMATLCKELDTIPNNYLGLLDDIYEMTRDTLKVKFKQMVFRRAARLL